jgi:uncharacterized protein YacL
MKLKGSFWLAVFFLALGLFGIIQSLTFVYWESMVLPLAVSIIIFVLAGVEVVKELRRRGDGEKDTAKDSEHKVENRRLGLILGWVAGFCLAIYLVGFYISIPVFTFAYLKWRRRSWLVAVIFTVVLLAFSYAVFAIGLKVPLYKGLIFGAR